MAKISSTQAMQFAEELLLMRDELIARGVNPGDVLVIIGCALGVRIAGNKG